MDPFAKVFMLISMGCVTALAGYCMSRILRTPPPGSQDSASQDSASEARSLD